MVLMEDLQQALLLKSQWGTCGQDRTTGQRERSMVCLLILLSLKTNTKVLLKRFFYNMHTFVKD